jgi:RNA polymerase sigma-70 factor, ECF subfamily
MSTAQTGPSSERALLDAARAGDESAYGVIVERHRRELHAHCYRMLGSVHDADDALQDAFLRAWRALARFEGRSSTRSWLYKIATNTCLDIISRRPKRVLPIDYGPPSDPHTGPGEPVTESVWIEPYPDERLGLEDGLASPEARIEQREAIELAFIAALQHLPARQRAALILREVLGFSAKEVAEALETTVPSVNSALQRARATIDDKLPEQSQQQTLAALEDEGVKNLVTTWVDAWERNDIEAVVAMLTEDAAIAMPPLARWYGPRDVFAQFLAGWPMSGIWRWKAVRTRANGQPALGFYTWDEAAGAYLPFALNVLTLRGDKVSDVVAFVVRTTEVEQERDFELWAAQPADAPRVVAIFERFGLPETLPA